VKKLAILMMCCAMTGCIMGKGKKPGDWKGGDAKPGDVSAEKKFAEKLPVVDPKSVTAENGALKARELEAELNRASKNLAAAKDSGDAVK
jgi:hypothetical protein